MKIDSQNRRGRGSFRRRNRDIRDRDNSMSSYAEDTNSNY